MMRRLRFGGNDILLEKNIKANAGNNNKNLQKISRTKRVPAQ